MVGAFVGVLLLLVLARFLYCHFTKEKDDDWDTFFAEHGENNTQYEANGHVVSVDDPDDVFVAATPNHRRKGSISKKMVERDFSGSAHASSQPYTQSGDHGTMSAWTTASQVRPTDRQSLYNARASSIYSHNTEFAPGLAGVGAHDSFVPPVPQSNDVHFDSTPLPMPQYPENAMYSPVAQQVGHVGNLGVVN